MLILSRRTGESVWIGNNVEIVVLGCKGNQVRVGIVAPDEVLVLRSELKERGQSGDASSRPHTP